MSARGKGLATRGQSQLRELEDDEDDEEAEKDDEDDNGEDWDDNEICIGEKSSWISETVREIESTTGLLSVVVEDSKKGNGLGGRETASLADVIADMHELNRFASPLGLHHCKT